jgi:hypothetical protein
MAVEGKVNVVPGSIKITMPKDLGDGRKPLPALFVGATSVVCHLTQGFNSAGVPNNEFGALTGGSIDTAINGPAWRAKGEFEIDTDNQPLLDQYEFGFIQIMFQGTFLLQYAGARPALGSIAMQPNFQDEHFLDSNPVHTPWTLPPNDRQIILNKRVTCFTGDHPAFLTKRRTENFHPSFAGSAAVDNHFQIILHSMHFITVLTQFDKRTLKPEPLASFRWNLKYRFDVKYLKGTPVVSSASELKFDPQAKLGTPDFNGDEKKIFEARSGNFFNTVAPPKYRAALQKGSPFRTESDDWFLNVPKDFFS